MNWAVTTDRQHHQKKYRATLETIARIVLAQFSKWFPFQLGQCRGCAYLHSFPPPAPECSHTSEMDLELRGRPCVWGENEQLGRLVVLCSERDQPERRVRALVPVWQTAQTPRSPERELSVKATAALWGHALCRKRSLPPPPLCPLLCGKNRSTDLSVQPFFMLLAFAWISPGASAAGSRLAFSSPGCLCASLKRALRERFYHSATDVRF